MKKIIFSVLLAIFVVAVVALAEFFPTVIVTGIAGKWTDTRAYIDIAAAVTAIGANERVLIVIGEEAVGTLTIPINVRLKFLSAGSLAVATQLTLQTYDIDADSRQIFSGAGDIDFPVGAVVKSSWFANLDEALDVTSDDTLTMVITESETLTADATVGANVTLKWNSPFIITDGGFTLDGLKKIEAGTYQIFSGANDFDFLAGSIVHSSWFVDLRRAITFTSDENIELTILVDQPETIDTNTTIDEYQSLEIKRGCVIEIETGDVFTVNGPFLPGPYYVFNEVGTGDVNFGPNACTEIYPEWWDVDGTADNIQIQQAIESASGLNGATIKLLPKDYNTTSTITVNRDRINIVGSGEMATRIVFTPTAADVCIEWDEGGTMISQCSIRDLTLYTADTTWAKVGMRLEDIDIFEMKNVQISGSNVNGWTGGAGSIGLQIQGRNIASIQNINIKADVPISIEDNPNSIYDIDHFNFNNLYLISKNDSTFPCVRVANGVNLQNVTFDGVQAWNYGSYGFYWSDTTTIQDSLALSFSNVRHEQSTDTTGYLFYIVHNSGLQNLSFNNIYGGEKPNGYYLRNIRNVSIEDSVFTNNVAGIALNIDLSVLNLRLHNNFWQTGTTFTSSDQTLVSGTEQQQGPLPVNAVYQATDATYNPTPHSLSDAPLSGTILTLADSGKAEIAQDSFVGYAFISSSSSYPALYVINGLNATVAEINDPGTLYTVTEDNDTTTNIYWDAGNARYEINNEEGASRDYFITLIGRTR